MVEIISLLSSPFSLNPLPMTSKEYVSFSGKTTILEIESIFGDNAPASLTILSFLDKSPLMLIGTFFLLDYLIVHLLSFDQKQYQLLDYNYSILCFWE